MRNLYEILGLAFDATNDQVRTAYRNKVKDVHPDVGGSNEAFSEVALAYETLIDEERRKRYDETGSVNDFEKEILLGARKIIEGLINDFIQRDDAKYMNVLDLMLASILSKVSEKNFSIAVLEKRRINLVDLKSRFKTKLSSEVYLCDLFLKKIVEIDNAVSSQRLYISQLNAASSVLNRYDYIRERQRDSQQTGNIDAAAFGRPFDPLFDTTELSPEDKT